MKRVFVDTNVFVRFLTHDDAGQADRAERLFRDAVAGRVALITGPPVFFELYWTLRRAYKVPRDRSLDILASVLAMEALEVTDRLFATSAVERARAAGGEFADAYVATAASGALVDEIATFNEGDFRRLRAALHRWAKTPSIP